MIKRFIVRLAVNKTLTTVSNLQGEKHSLLQSCFLFLVVSDEDAPTPGTLIYLQLCCCQHRLIGFSNVGSALLCICALLYFIDLHVTDELWQFGRSADALMAFLTE